MLYEFRSVLEKIKGILQVNLDIANNNGPDTIDLADLNIVPAELISSCFDNSEAYRMPSIVAKREATDIITGHRRLYEEHLMQRSEYYAAAVKETENLVGFYTYTDAVLQRLDRKGTV